MAIEYINIFTNLIQHKESEVVEFKKAENNFDFDDLGKYFSALSNEANLRKLDFAWLIFGYDEKRHEIVGTSYKNGEGALNNLKHDFSQHTTDGQTFREIIPIEVDGKRILMFKIPASPRNIVMKWKGIAYGRDGESLKPLNQSKQDEIRRQRDVQPGICRRALHVRNRFATLWGEIGGFGVLYLQEKSNYGKYIESTEPPRPGIKV